MPRSRSRAGSGSGFAPAGWHAVEPKTQPERRALAARCGTDAFLLQKADGELKFPIVPMDTKDCAPDRRGLIAAKNRAHINDYPAVEAKATALLHTLFPPTAAAQAAPTKTKKAAAKRGGRSRSRSSAARSS